MQIQKIIFSKLLYIDTVTSQDLNYNNSQYQLMTVQCTHNFVLGLTYILLDQSGNLLVEDIQYVHLLDYVLYIK